jgi:2-polyprenyl-3-methyl-5-hydroxy-6-metoxy-1,4-benzoquinol methylase
MAKVNLYSAARRAHASICRDVGGPTLFFRFRDRFLSVNLSLRRRSRSEDQLDRFWKEICDFAESKTGLVLGPRLVFEQCRKVYPYELDRPDVKAEFLIFHKGLAHEVPWSIWTRYFGMARPCFANEVFVVFSVEGSDDENFQSFFHQNMKSPSENSVASGRDAAASRTDIGALLRKTDREGHPNINDLWFVTKDIDWMKFNIKNYGYELARTLRAGLPPLKNTSAKRLGLSSRPSRQADIDAKWFPHWCAELKIPVLYHRKTWEFGFLLQSLFDAGLLRAGVRALGFGCGEEPIAAYLAGKGALITVTDLAPEIVAGRGWVETGQHTDSIEKAFHPELVDRRTFDRNVQLRHVDMNAIPDDLQGFDFCWSICAFEHLGSIRKGLDFIKNSLKTLRPGGYSIHTTEYNFASEDETVDNWDTVLFLRKHFEQLAAELRAEGHDVAPLDFDVGDDPMDRFVDIPPYGDSSGWVGRADLKDEATASHLKLAVDGFACTCFGLVVRKAG